ncbi:MAG: cytochrome C [Campylobacteraceae bacterium]|nr:cytochrome C [Campylobacteraceae bacterium]
MRIIWILFLTTIFAWGNMGQLLYEGNCYTCHGIEKADSAPSAKAIQDRYKQTFATKKAFIDFMRTWIQTPNATTALMPEEIARYGIMPTLGYDDFTLNEIGEYMYEMEFDSE